MIICQCAVVTDHEVDEAVRAGATDVCALAEMCGAGRTCGGCLPEVRTVLRRHGLPTDDGLDARTIRTIMQARRNLSAAVTRAS